MGDVMVTARMSKAKKEAGARVLESIGSNASQMVNEVYDYLIAHGDSPFSQAQNDSAPHALSANQIAQALSQIDDMSLPAGNRFAAMSDADIRRERLQSRGLLG